jgi:plastocyanin
MNFLRLPALVAALLLLPMGVAPVQAAGKVHHVAIEGMKFVPGRLEVAAGDTVVWTNKDIVPHTVTAQGAKVESGEIGPDKSWKFVARKKGEIPYICRLHPVMHGTLVVK